MVRASGIPDVNQQGDHYEEHESDGKGGAQGPISPLAELQLDEVSKHHVFAAAQNTRGDIGSKRGNEHQNGAGDDARLDQRDNDAAKNLKPGCVEIVSRLDEAKVELLHAGVERQDHQREINVDHAEHNSEIGKQDLNGPVDKTRPHKQGVDDAFIADHFHDCESANEQIRPEWNRSEEHTSELQS